MSGKKNYEELILSHYRQVAGNYNLGARSTMEDTFIRDAEVNFVRTEVARFMDDLGRPPSVLDVGCGNGNLLSSLRPEFPACRLYGREFTPELLHLALSRGLPGVEFAYGDIRKKNFFPGPVDVIVTERVIINILDREDQLAALENLAGLLRSGGRYIMIESFEEPLELLNKAAQEMCLPLLKQSKQNLYVNEETVGSLRKLGFKELAPRLPSNFLSTHFFNTRILHRAARRPGGKVKNTEFVKFLDLAFPPAIGNYSPILMRVFTL